MLVFGGGITYSTVQKFCEPQKKKHNGRLSVMALLPQSTDLKITEAVWDHIIDKEWDKKGSQLQKSFELSFRKSAELFLKKWPESLPWLCWGIMVNIHWTYCLIFL